MSQLSDAINDLKDRLIDTGYREGLVEAVAEDWDLKAPLLRRKFTENLGHAPEDWDVQAYLEAKIRGARAEAEDMKRNFAPAAMRLQLEDGSEEIEIFGLPVMLPGRRLAVVIAANDRDLIVIEAGSAVSGNPMARVSIEKELGGRERMLALLREAAARRDAAA